MSIFSRRSFSHIPVLLYHSVSDDVLDERLTMDIISFKHQMNIIKKWGFKPITIEDYEKYRINRNRSMHKKVLITFDDGFEDNYTNAFPILSNNNFPAVVFLITGLINEKATWLENHPQLSEKKMLTWEQIKKMKKGNIAFGSHAVNHTNLSFLNRKELIIELGSSKEIIEKELNCRVSSLSYPFSAHSSPVIEIARKCGYTVAFAVDSGDNTAFRLNRTKCNGPESRFIFLLKLLGWYTFFINLKKRLIIRNVKSN